MFISPHLNRHIEKAVGEVSDPPSLSPKLSKAGRARVELTIFGRHEPVVLPKDAHSRIMEGSMVSFRLKRIPIGNRVGAVGKTAKSLGTSHS